MKKALTCCALALALTSLSSMAKQDKMAVIDHQIASWVAQHNYSGAAIIIVKDDKPIFEKYYGGYTSQTEVHIASAGKWLAAATIASLVDDGVLSWDDPVRKWLPAFTDSKGDATLRQLFSHTSGYPDYQPANKPEDHYQTLTESVAHILPLPSVNPPGTTFNYGGLAMQVAGRMAEVASGKSWESLFQEHIAQPLGMTHTGFTPVSEEQGFSPMLAGGARTTLADYRRFLQMVAHNGQFEGRRILSTAAITMMQSDQLQGAKILPGAVNRYVQDVRGQARNDIYGLGEWREQVDNQGRPLLISSPGWAGSYPWIDKTNNSYGVILAKVNLSVAHKTGFNSFYAGPQLIPAIREALATQ